VLAGGRNGLTAWLDQGSQELIIEAVLGNRRVRTARPLPSTFRYDTWHEIEMIIEGSRLQVAVSESGQYDPVAESGITIPQGLRAGPIALRASGTGAEFDDLTAARLFTPVTEREPDPTVGGLDQEHSDEFDADLGPQWQWVRSPAASITDGVLAFGVQTSSLVDNRPNPDQASVLTRSMPAGTWTVETKINIPFGDTLPYGWPSAGLIAYNNDDEWVDLVYTARTKPRFVAFSKETPAPGGGPVYGHAAVGPSRDTMYLRLQHTVSDNGEHLYRAATSLDGETWSWHGTRVLPAGEQPRVGLVAMGVEANPEQQPLTARFDWFRVYR
jgi:hypothetical protein